MSVISGYSEKVSVNPFLPISTQKNKDFHNLSPMSNQ